MAPAPGDPAQQLGGAGLFFFPPGILAASSPVRQPPPFSIVIFGAVVVLILFCAHLEELIAKIKAKGGFCLAGHDFSAHLSEND